MAGTKHIRSDDKNAGPLRLLADAWLLGAGEARREEPAAGVMVCRGWMDGQ